MVFSGACSCYPLYLFRQNIYGLLKCFRLPKKGAAAIRARAFGFYKNGIVKEYFRILYDEFSL
ncbi:hypothetical protein DMB68_05110 [Flavobacterium hydrophilum]|uniref:Uncharacterized protein n=1 Tax=Flavobacterium hydrophilum TaxID=2211445 RepID=A0A2V4C997_9FLAO|nr:hypothetical protein DMB68_05110 [Flavobacterium hydrophilum]